jgi:arylsulfatase A-like enzyme
LVTLSTFIVNALQAAGIYNNTLLIITAKHGDSPIDPTRYVADGTNTPAASANVAKRLHPMACGSNGR